jgi:pimeloyl-ACP methyl ester carboxylesterase/tetratricopeptide (TPR) repeat protein
MAAVAAQYPDEPNVQTLYADAVMNTMPWDYWQKDGAPRPATATLMRALERVIGANPYHAGAHHYYIHLIEASPTPERAEKSADALGALLPAAGHMVHMPAHIYLRVGRYADAAEANVRAIAADEDYIAQCQAQGLYPISYYPHNLHFLWAAATLEGRSAVAIQAARDVAAKVPHHHAGKLAWTADFPVTPWLAYVRFGQWQQMLVEPAPPVDQPYAMGIWHYGRALALLARNEKSGRVASELAALKTILIGPAFATALKGTPLQTNLQIAGHLVAGEMAAKAGRYDVAVMSLREAVELEDALPYSEPPIWHQPVRQVLGAVLLEAGRVAEAEAVYREDLAQVRENGWSLFGLARALEAQGRLAEAAAVRTRFAKAWARADIRLTSSRVMAETTAVPAAPATPQTHSHSHSARSEEIPTMVQSRTLPTGVTLEYAERGSASGMPVVLLHGVTDSWRSFEHLLPHFPSTIRAIDVTLRGHGDSSRPEADYRYADMASDVRALMDALGIPAAVIVGHSMGASVAQQLAADHPSRVAGLVLIGSFADGNAAVREFYEKEIAVLTDPVPDAFARGFQESTLVATLPAGQLDTFVGESLKLPAYVWKSLFQGFVDTPCPCRKLGDMAAPTLLIWGDRDAYVSRVEQDALLAAIPGSRLVIYPGTGHAVHWEEPRRSAADIVSFVYARP